LKDVRERLAPQKRYRFVILSLFRLYFTSHRIYTLCCLPSAVCSVLRPIKVAENKVIKELLNNPLFVLSLNGK